MAKMKRTWTVSSRRVHMNTGWMWLVWNLDTLDREEQFEVRAEAETRARALNARTEGVGS